MSVSPIHSNVAHMPASYQVLTLPELVSRITSFFPNAGYAALARGISKTWHTACTDFLTDTLVINEALAPFFDDVLAFRRLQCTNNVIISGSFALKFFRPFSDSGTETAPNSDLDLYVESSVAADVHTFLLESGYTRTNAFYNRLVVNDELFVFSLPDSSFTHVFRFEKGDRYIDLIYTVGTPLRCIFNFHCSVVMNIITWNRAYCLWPLASLLEGRGVILSMNNERARRAIEKYEDRGFVLLRWRDETAQTLRDSLGPGIRWVGDAKCWVVELDILGVLSTVDPVTRRTVHHARASTYQYDVNGFHLTYHRAAGPSKTADGCLWQVPSIDTCLVLDHTALRCTYAVPRSFYRRVMSYIFTVVSTHTRFWRVLSPGVDHRLRGLKLQTFLPCWTTQATPLILPRRNSSDSLSD